MAHKESKAPMYSRKQEEMARRSATAVAHLTTIRDSLDTWIVEHSRRYDASGMAGSAARKLLTLHQTIQENLSRRSADVRRRPEVNDYGD